MADDRASTELSEQAYGRALFAKRGQAAQLGECWAERICRGDLRAQPVWPEHDEKALVIARQLVASLAKNDPRLLDELARACSAGAAAWWERRPMRYRVEPTSWRLETAPDERERCMFVGDGVRCERRTEWLIGSVIELAYAYLCGVHLDFVRHPGDPAEIVERPS